MNDKTEPTTEKIAQWCTCHPQPMAKMAGAKLRELQAEVEQKKRDNANLRAKLADANKILEAANDSRRELLKRETEVQAEVDRLKGQVDEWCHVADQKGDRIAALQRRVDGALAKCDEIDSEFNTYEGEAHASFLIAAILRGEDGDDA